MREADVPHLIRVVCQHIHGLRGKPAPVQERGRGREGGREREGRRDQNNKEEAYYVQMLCTCTLEKAATRHKWLALNRVSGR